MLGKFREVVARGEHVAVCLNEYDANGVVFFGLRQGVGERAVHIVGQGVFLVRARDGERENALRKCLFYVFDQLLSPIAMGLWKCA